jgi:hypothetical protein
MQKAHCHRGFGNLSNLPTFFGPRNFLARFPPLCAGIGGYHPHRRLNNFYLKRLARLARLAKPLWLWDFSAANLYPIEQQRLAGWQEGVPLDFRQEGVPVDPHPVDKGT